MKTLIIIIALSTLTACGDAPDEPLEAEEVEEGTPPDNTPPPGYTPTPKYPKIASNDVKCRPIEVAEQTEEGAFNGESFTGEHGVVSVKVLDVALCDVESSAISIRPSYIQAETEYHPDISVWWNGEDELKSIPINHYWNIGERTVVHKDVVEGMMVFWIDADQPLTITISYITELPQWR